MNFHGNLGSIDCMSVILSDPEKNSYAGSVLLTSIRSIDSESLAVQQTQHVATGRDARFICDPLTQSAQWARYNTRHCALHPMTEWLAFPNYSGSDIEIPHRSWSVVVASANRVKGRRFYLLLVAFLQNPARRGQSFSRYNPL